MIRIDVNIDMSDLEAAMTRLRGAAQDTTPIMRRCAGVLAGAAEDAFDDEADPVTGAKWQPLAASTAAAGAAAGHSGKILQLTGSLASSLERDFGRNYAVVGTAKSYAAAHQFGAVTKPHVIRARNGKALKIPGVGFRRSVNHPGSTIPARPFLGIGPDDEKDLLEIFHDELHKALYG